MTREKVAQLILRASTPAECEAAEEALERWMQAHPEDQAMREAAEGLDLLRLEPRRPGEEPVGPTLEDVPPSDLEYFTSPRYAEAFEADVQRAIQRFGWDYSEAYDFVASYQPAPGCRSADRHGSGEPPQAAPVEHGASGA